MFRPAKIHHIVGAVVENKVNLIVNRLHELGICELKEAEIDLSSKYSYELVKSVDELYTRFNIITDMLERYKEVVEPVNRIKELFSPQMPAKHKSIIYSTEQIVEEVKKHLDAIEPKVNEKINNLHKINEAVKRNEFVISNLILMPDLKTELFRSSEEVNVFAGLISGSSLPLIKVELEERAVMIADEHDKNHLFITVVTLAEDSAKAEKLLHNTGFQMIEVPYEGKKPAEIIKDIKKEIEVMLAERDKIEKFLARMHKTYEKKFMLLGEELEIAKQKIKALHNFKTTEAFSVIEAWVPDKNLEKFCDTLKENSKQYYIEVEQKEEAPTLFNNPKWISPFEMITELYSPPKYKEFDPTPIIAITFALFFGFMLTDAAYGILLSVFGIMMYRGIGRINEGMKKFSMIMIVLGISTTIMGVIFGSYFGDFFQKIGINLPILIDSMKQVLLTLIIALAIGYLHLLIGLGVGFYENIRKKHVRDAFSKQGVWLFFSMGILMMVLRGNIFGMFSIGIAVFMQLLLNFLDGGLVSSLLSVFSFSGYIGDLFSYARLMALAISTAGIALSVNFMVLMAIGSIPIIGWPIGILIFIVGHLFNIAMNSLGAFIHSTRLHFLEFFTKFYDGGGRMYRPFKAERKNTYIVK
ncbi:MAG: V-type ATP synthase subunit I [Nanoarchaeota archaeon]|nr:V-type ATP synthase subunit I [Nanoarchaeota archaeon]MBU1946976.1 V-type ATP synthase subunit I [Nanoarchaeota archaeon]